MTYYGIVHGITYWYYGLLLLLLYGVRDRHLVIYMYYLFYIYIYIYIYICTTYFIYIYICVCSFYLSCIIFLQRSSMNMFIEGYVWRSVCKCISNDAQMCKSHWVG